MGRASEHPAAWVRRKRGSGELSPTPKAGGTPSTIQQPQVDAIVARLRDATANGWEAVVSKQGSKGDHAGATAHAPRAQARDRRAMFSRSLRDVSPGSQGPLEPGKRMHGS